MTGTQGNPAPAGPPPGWYDDPGGSPALRWWDGTRWTEHTQGAARKAAAPHPRPRADVSTAPVSPPGKGRHKTAAAVVVGAALLIIILIAVGAALGSKDAPKTAAAPSSAYEPTAPASSAAAPSGPCTSKACIASDAEGLKGTVTKDASVMTGVTCRASTVREVVSGTYTVDCTATYADGSVWDGIADVETSQDDIGFEPTTMVSAGDSGD